jgi:hypothetical protein
LRRLARSVFCGTRMPHEGLRDHDDHQRPQPQPPPPAAAAFGFYRSIKYPIIR